jgi:hypothetical protein
MDIYWKYLLANNLQTNSRLSFVANYQQLLSGILFTIVIPTIKAKSKLN